MKFALCSEVFQTPLEETMRRVAGIGFDGIEIAPFNAAASVDEVGPTITNEYRRGRLPAHYKSRPGDATTDLSQVRALTLREAAMLQTFPDRWDWLPGEVKRADAWQMVANAVPPKLARHLGKALLAAEVRL